MNNPVNMINEKTTLQFNSNEHCLEPLLEDILDNDVNFHKESLLVLVSGYAYTISVTICINRFLFRVELHLIP